MSELQQKIRSKMVTPILSALATISEEGKPWVRYVTPVMDDQMNILFTTHLMSRKVAQMRKNPEVHLTTGVSAMETAESYLQVQGLAEVKTDPALKKAMWHEYLANIFSGPDDPNYAVVEIKPYRIEYQGMDMKPAQVWEK